MIVINNNNNQIHDNDLTCVQKLTKASLNSIGLLTNKLKQCVTMNGVHNAKNGITNESETLQ